MTLLTAKDENNTYNKHKVTIKHKPFEYLVMEMFQPFNRISEVRHNTCSANWQHGNSRDRYETSGNELRFLYDNLGFAGKSDSNEDIQNTDLQTDFNFDKSESILKYVQSAQESKEHTFTKLSKNLWFAKRNVKRFLDIKKSITNSVKEGSKYFKINYDKRFICKKRKRKNKSDVDLGLDSLVSKAFRNKSVDGVVIEVVEDSSTDLVNGSNAPANIRTPLEENQASRDAKQENDCNHKFLILSNFLKEETLDIRAVDENDEYLSKKSNDVNDVEIQNSGKLKTSAVQTKRQNTRKLGFWGSLRLRRRRTRSPHLFSINLKNEPSFYNFFTNYKRRKKRRFKKEENTDIERNVNEDTLSYRESRNLHEEESYKRMAKYSGILDMENTDILMGLEPTVFEGVNKEEPIEPKREAIFSDNEVNIQRAEIKPKLTERKLKAVEKRQVSRELEIRSANEFVIMYDDKNVAGDSAFRFGERLKTITHSLKKKKKRRSVVFSEEAPEVKYSDSDSEDTKHFIQVQSNDQLENEPQCVHQNMVCLNSDSDGTEIDEAKFEDNTKFTQYYNNNTAEIEQEAPCVHEWKVEPKKQGECQTCACEYDEDNLDTSSHSLVNRCFQVMLPAKRMSEMNSVAVNVVGSDEDSFDKPLEKGVQVKCVCPCNDRLKTELESEAVAKLQERWCNCEGKHDTNANADGNGNANANASLNQTREAYTGFPAAEVKNTETQYLPTFHAAVQSYGISECFSKDRVPAKPVKGKVIKEVTERRLFWPDSDDVTLQYADEKTVKPKKNRSTTTVAKTVADASTITSDWWSPLLERKPMRRKTEMIIIGSNHSYDNKYNCPTSNWDSSLYRNDTASVLSASNYLIQSEQYYNQVYSVDIKTSSSRHKEVKEHKEATKLGG
ncbi:uncharacterized protein LOC125238278 isoform X2 [Leguminivora glycinivorella]|uniref:uncharacterized protein LOC125238278 isoform X2 n=1 Tax=Leguminivora glycinivorella TaxID=1035111 RepID=UPI00200DE7D1|nr:uncharacterized protein LOC125238278 isoform X2 [Leguminivora glycinivorella]